MATIPHHEDLLNDTGNYCTCLFNQPCTGLCEGRVRLRRAGSIALELPRDEHYGLNLLCLAVYCRTGSDIDALAAKAARNGKLTKVDVGKTPDEFQGVETYGPHFRSSLLRHDPIRVPSPTPPRAIKRIKLNLNRTASQSSDTSNSSDSSGQAVAQAISYELGEHDDEMMDLTDSYSDEDSVFSSNSSASVPSPTHIHPSPPASGSKKLPARASPARRSPQNSTQAEKKAAIEIQSNGVPAAVACEQCIKAFENKESGATCKSTTEFPVCKFARGGKRSKCARCISLKQKCIGGHIPESGSMREQLGSPSNERQARIEA